MSNQDYMLPPMYNMSTDQVLTVQSANLNNLMLSQNDGNVNLSVINLNSNRQRKPNNSMAQENSRTPLGTLNELCSKAKVTPVFQFTAEGPVHNCRFECHVSVNKDGMGTEAKAIGVGKNKKDAKHDAAKKLLLGMDARLVEQFDGRFNQREEAPQLPECDPEPPGNPVGELNELCLRAKRVVPEYEDENQDGAPHERVFSVTCKIGSKLFEVGRGRSKKQAKRAAAYKMLQRIMVLMRNRENEEPQNVDEFDASLDEKFQNMSFTVNKSKPLKKLSEVIKEHFRGRSGDKLDLIHNDNQGILKTLDPLRLLKGITDEQKLPVDWMEFQRPPDESQTYCLLSIGAEPMLVFWGCGESHKQSKMNAAENAVKFLRVATK